MRDRPTGPVPVIENPGTRHTALSSANGNGTKGRTCQTRNTNHTDLRTDGKHFTNYLSVRRVITAPVQCHVCQSTSVKTVPATELFMACEGTVMNTDNLYAGTCQTKMT